MSVIQELAGGREPSSYKQLEITNPVRRNKPDSGLGVVAYSSIPALRK